MAEGEPAWMHWVLLFSALALNMADSDEHFYAMAGRAQARMVRFVIPPLDYTLFPGPLAV
jgi:hypothetical protein